MRSRTPFWNRFARPELSLLLFGVAVNLPFLFQPFHMDDRLYLEVADNILRQPVLPYQFPIIFEGEQHSDAAGGSHLPLTAYYLALVRLLSGVQSEWVYHLAFLLFPVLAGIAFHDLARRVVKHPVAASLFLLISPGVFTLSHTVMTDVPQLSFWLLALSRYFRISDGSLKKSDWLGCAIGLAASAFTSLLAAGLSALLLAHWLWKIKPLGSDAAGEARGKAVLFCVLPPLVWTVWYGRAFFIYDRLVLTDLAGHVLGRGVWNLDLMGEKLVSFLLNTGSTIVFPVALFLVLRNRRVISLAALVFISSAAVIQIRGDDWSSFRSLLFALCLTAGLTVFWFMCDSIPLLSRKARRAESLTMLLLFWWVLATCLLVFYSGAVRYTLLAVPSVILFWIERIENQFAERHSSILIWLGFLVTLPYGLWIAAADLDSATAYQRAAQEVVRSFRSEHGRVWFSAEWGVRFYLEKEGAEPLLKMDNAPAPGDILVKSRQATPWRTLYDSSDFTSLIETRTLNSRWLIQLMNPRLHAGFYSTHWGILPYGVSSEPEFDSLDVYRIHKKHPGSAADGQQRSSPPAYAELRLRIREAVSGLFQGDSLVLVVCRGDDELIDLLGPNFRHFPQSAEGGYAGYYPGDSAEAVAGLERLISGGARYILFPETSRWWLQDYPGLEEFMSLRGEVVLDEPGVAIAFSLSPASDSSR